MRMCDGKILASEQPLSAQNQKKKKKTSNKSVVANNLLVSSTAGDLVAVNSRLVCADLCVYVNSFFNKTRP